MTQTLLFTLYRWRHSNLRLPSFLIVMLLFLPLLLNYLGNDQPKAYGHAADASVAVIARQTSFTCTTVMEIPNSECEALVAFYKSTNGASWIGRSDWLENDRPCSWFGITCHANHVVGIDLNSKGLTGELSTALGSLTQLQQLDLTNNQITGAIPAELAQAPLSRLDLGRNQLSGPLPEALGKLFTLQALHVNNNMALQGPLPLTMINLRNLNTFTFDDTQLCSPEDDSFQQWLDRLPRVQSSGLICVTSEPQLLAVYFLAFDNHPADIDINLSPQYRAVVEKLLAATQASPNKTVALVADLDGVGDTHLVIVRQGAVERVLGASTLNTLLTQKFGGWNLGRIPESLLPDSNGDLTPPLTFEYNMTDSATLGGVLRWLFTTYVNDAPATRTLVSFIGHGAAAIPNADVANAIGLTQCTGEPVYGIPSSDAGLVALPSSRGAHPAFTDCHGVFDLNSQQYRPALLAPQSLARALQTATTQSPITQVDILDIFHCFALSLEALVELAPTGVPVAHMVIGSPSYAFFAPEMVGQVVAADELTATPQERAAAIINRYDALLRAALPATIDQSVYPRLLIAVEASKIQTILDRWNAVVERLLQTWADPAMRPGVRQSLAAAYNNAGKYDSTYCQGDPAAATWELKAPDALADLANFAQRLGENSADPAVQQTVQALLDVVTDAIGNRRIAVDGVPLGLHPTAAVEWHFAGYGGISLYADLDPMQLPGVGASRSWQAFWYNNGRQAYRFTAQSQWDDLLNLIWQADDPNGTVKKAFCLPELVMLPEDGGIGLKAEAISIPSIQPLLLGQAVPLAATIRAESATTRYTEVRFQVTMDSQQLFTETVVITRLLAAGEVIDLSTNRAWTPTKAGSATVTVTVDPNNRILEENENNNSVSQPYTIVAPPPQEQIFLSSTSDGRIGALSFADEDILRFDPATNAWSLFFDGSDVGLNKADIDGLQFLSDGTLLLSLDKTIKLAGVGQVNDSDLLRFQPTKLGPVTAGSFTRYFDGSDVALTTDGEDIDAVALSPDGQLIFSTAGTAKVGNVTAQDEDLLRFTQTALGDNTSGSWGFFFDGSDIGLTKKNDIGGIALTDANTLYFSVTGSFALPGIKGDGSDILRCTPLVAGEKSACPVTLFWDGAAHQFKNEVIDALDIRTPSATTVAALQAGLVDATVNAAGDNMGGDGEVAADATIEEESSTEESATEESVTEESDWEENNDADLEEDEESTEDEDATEMLPQLFYLPLIVSQ